MSREPRPGDDPRTPQDVRVVRFGPAALLVELPGLAQVRRADDALRRARRAGGLLAAVEDQVPAAESVLLRVPPGTDLRALAAHVRAVVADALAAAPDVPGPAPGGRLVVLPVTYDGPDLAEVATLTGLPVDEVVARHRAPTYTVAFGGFMPGFAYLVGLDPALVVPRRGTPRARVPAGAVAVADRFSAVYPAATPGGWRLLGTCRTVLFDAHRDEPALLTPGTRVRFEPA
ncbi:allophanate hydrolase subunit 1 [Cellulomonas sp.]|uniref:5-oxoprolinase subunit B family protein n=1 Tax=Cellulomonas sp. TaxID=40001 RepID=UPI00258BF02D|nr:allophanate hydrolase subunit 1 [Cellulomonas sp.]MCR6689129.1 allophanate hydrolase subunit 1 [Cellulomonas sp.]